MITALLLFGAAFPAGAAGSYFLSEGFYYGVKNKEASVHGYQGEDSDVVIREKYLSYNVTSIDDYAFSNNEIIKTLSFYDASQLRSLGNCVFSNCVNLEQVNITSSIREMGISVFDGCTSLSYARFREGSLAEIPAQTFYGCTSLKTVVFENAVTSIGNFTFGNCASLKIITIPDSVNSISDNAFNGCNGLVIICNNGSYAMQYAERNEINYFTPEESSYIIGDTDGNGVVGIRDVTWIQLLLAGYNVNSPGGIMFRGDCDGNGLDINDATNIQLWMARLNVKEPIGEIKKINL